MRRRVTKRRSGEFFGRVRAELGPVDILVNNAGIVRDGLLVFMKRAQWDEVLATNLTGAFLCIRAVAREMLMRRWGRIINIVSASGEVGGIGQAGYSASKAGLLGLTRTLAREFAQAGRSRERRIARADRNRHAGWVVRREARGAIA